MPRRSAAKVLTPQLRCHSDRILLRIFCLQIHEISYFKRSDGAPAGSVPPGLTGGPARRSLRLDLNHAPADYHPEITGVYR